METTIMPGNLKKLIRARRAKTGESHQSALRHVRDQRPPSFEAIVHRVIQLAKERNREYDEDPRNHGRRALRQLLERILEPPPPGKAALTRALMELPYRDLRKIEVLMYSGRDGGDVHSLARTLREDSHDVTVIVITQKSPLDRYLEQGLARAKRDGVDLEADF
ncbi:hypothetical protein [Sorangium sp. So ce1389]|uniref:hypothetical protein n=1 Tax=Sorangium sp. So ce1389 TaxID=3133336 RepID=UPI003F5E4302